MTNKYLDILSKIQSETVENVNDRVLIIDGTNSYLRIWSSVPFMADNGEHAGGIVGFLRSIGSNIRDFNPSRCVVVFDGKGGSNRRRKIYPEYKQQRSGKHNLRREEFLSYEDEHASMRNQMIRVGQYLDTFPIQMIVMDNIEADDIIAHAVSSYFVDPNSKIRIVSTDRDFLQLVTDRVEVWSPVKKKLYTPEVIADEYGFHPNNYLLYRTLTGDVADNIDGVRGLGLKTLLKNFGELVDIEFSVDQFLEYAELIDKPKKIHETVIASRSIIERNHLLMQLGDVDISAHSKFQITDILNEPICRANSHTFKKMLIEDYIGTAFKYPDEWIRDTFSRLNQFAK